MTSIGDLTLEQFQPLADATFAVRNPDGEAAEFVLAEVKDLTQAMQLPDGSALQPGDERRCLERCYVQTSQQCCCWGLRGTSSAVPSFRFRSRAE